jgi:Ca2+-dependent lipid-binding protein
VEIHLRSDVEIRFRHVTQLLPTRWWEMRIFHQINVRRSKEKVSHFTLTFLFSQIAAANVPCLGWLEVSLSYEESRETVICTILRARDLPAMDAQGLSDPFCKVNIITGENTIRHSRWQKSRIAHRSINPEFNETFTFIGMNAEDACNSQLYIVILDDDKYGNDFLGATKVSLGMVSENLITNLILSVT